MKKLFTLLVLFLTLEALPQEVIIIDGPRNELYIYEEQLVKGDKDALKEIGKFLGSNKKIYESLGYHLLYTKEKEISLRIIEENTLFTSEEIKLDSNLTASAYKKFISDNYENIKFSDKLGVFYITPFDKRKYNYKLRILYEIQRDTLLKQKESLIHFFYKENSSIVEKIKHGNPECLKEIAEIFYFNRIKYDKYHFDEIKNCINFLALLTNSELLLADPLDSIFYEVNSLRKPEVITSYLLYWLNHYNDYNFDKALNCFVNTQEKNSEYSQTEKLFAGLFSKNDSAAINAFVNISVLNTDSVIYYSEVFKDYFQHYRYNYVLGSFIERRLIGLSKLTKYFRENNIDFYGTEDLRKKIFRLLENIQMKERLSFENDLVENLTLHEVNVLEYWASVYKSSDFSASAAAVLDRFYSEHWNEIISSEKNLKNYIFKASIFKSFGIHGTCNEYYKKFDNTDDKTLSRLRKINIDDENTARILNKIFVLNSDSVKKINEEIINSQLNEIKNSAVIGISYEGSYKHYYGSLKVYNKFGTDNFNSYIENPVREITDILNSNIKEDEKNKKINKVISEINYEGIGSVLSIINEAGLQKNKYIRDFIKRDFAIPINFDFEISMEMIYEFKNYYSKFSEKELYEFYLKKSGVEYTHVDGSPNYAKIYKFLKYNRGMYFMGGTSWDREMLACTLVKYLELHFNTTLGFPRKICNSGSSYRCSFGERIEEWMLYLKEKKLISYDDNEPQSFYED
ncbi:MAG: hypothetical protein K1X86_08810 [Ignavibacteria bacterium]|nr:hypothetical protein [Ignavibacteria bacterium]